LGSLLVGTGGWAYFEVPGKSALKAYSEVFNFTEVNYTFYEYPRSEMVENWHRTVPTDFIFAVRCHQDLTHGIGLRPLDGAYQVLGQMLHYCDILDAPFLVLETPASYAMNAADVGEARDFLSSVDLRGVRLVWEYRAPLNSEVTDLMREFGIVHAVDLSKCQDPAVASDVLYSRLFGKGQKNLYQFTDEELVDIDRKVLDGLASGVKTAALSYHGVRMNTDAIRFVKFKQTGQFLPVSPFTGKKSIQFVLAEDISFPASRQQLIDKEGWKVVDLTPDKRVHLVDVLSKLPEKQYGSVTDVLFALEDTV
jgi:uncharacterized protein YecE (DUF72 family)